MAHVTVGVSLKMYFGHLEAAQWLAEVAAVARENEAVMRGDVALFVIPGYLQLADALTSLAGTPVRVGAQDLAAADTGAYTGEVSGTELAEIGVTLAEVGHAERRRLFGETDDIVAAKTAAALRNGLIPVLCVGETERIDAPDAAAETIAQVHDALADAAPGPVIVAYEPVWAIGAPQPAPVPHIAAVAVAVRAEIRSIRPGSIVIYGGAAGPGLLTALGRDVDGLFLGRFAHDTAALASVLAEASALADARSTS